MALSRSDKFLILGAVVLAFSVVVGLALWKKPHLFFGEKQVIDSRLAAEKSSPPSVPAAPGKTASPAPAAQQTPIASSSTPVTSPMPTPQMSALPEEPAKKEKPKPLPGEGQKTLDRMFAELEREAQTTPSTQSSEPTPQATGAPPDVILPAYTPTPAPVRPTTPKVSPASPPAKTTPKKQEPKPEVKPTPKTVSKPAPKAQSSARSGQGQIVSISQHDGQAEYTLTIKTNARVPRVETLFLTGPPRFVVDLPGRWTYRGRSTLSGKSALVKTIRVGKHKDKVRVVIDLRPGAVNRLRGRPEVKTTATGAFVVIPK
ncbi:AMIN domain-containing protein [Desulfovibrio inopinatus]|uniref:AMIN domain-containing protein n=1 Tax=Desulfovibrio inopinatus TaxID=102109 RepID=UPI00042A69FC|nr:AMIN domain-containing protein [Desulfovibrio inopinatus]